MKTIMIHELNDDFTNFLKTLDGEDIFTFDDGLYSQYKFMIENKGLLEKHKCLFFISTNIICPEDIEQSEDFITSDDAHTDYFETGNLKNYMKLSQIRELKQFENVSIGMHGHNHIRFGGDSIRKRFLQVNDEVKLMVDKMKLLKLETDIFCFPYNFEEPLYKGLLVRNGFTDFYGEDRTDFFTLFNAWDEAK